jgi:hypothetical protein
MLGWEGGDFTPVGEDYGFVDLRCILCGAVTLGMN